MKAENTKERKREKKERKGGDLVWLICAPMCGKHFSSAVLKNESTTSTNGPHERVRSARKPLGAKFQGNRSDQSRAGNFVSTPKWGNRKVDCGRTVLLEP